MAEIIARRTVQHKWGWMTQSDFTDFTLERLKWRLDADRKAGGDLLSGWEKSVIFRALREAKAGGPDWRLIGQLRKDVREVLTSEESVLEDA